MNTKIQLAGIRDLLRHLAWKRTRPIRQLLVPTRQLTCDYHMHQTVQYRCLLNFHETWFDAEYFIPLRHNCCM